MKQKVIKLSFNCAAIFGTIATTWSAIALTVRLVTSHRMMLFLPALPTSALVAGVIGGIALIAVSLVLDYFAAEE